MKNTHFTLILTLALLITASGCYTYAAAPTTAITTAESTAATEMTKELTETAAAATTSETAAETTGETAATTTAALPAVNVLAAPAAYTASYDTVRIYTDANRTKVQAVLTKGDQVTITGTAGKYGVTAEGFYVNLNLMTLIITATPTPEETTAATTKETVKPTTKPTKATTAATDAPTSSTAAPPVETAPPPTAAPAYTENCDNIKSLIIGQLQAKGLWYPDAEVNGGGLIQLSVGFGNSDEQYATAFVNGKFGTPDGIGAASVSVWIESGYLNLSYIGCILPAA